MQKLDIRYLEEIEIVHVERIGVARVKRTGTVRMETVGIAQGLKFFGTDTVRMKEIDQPKADMWLLRQCGPRLFLRRLLAIRK